MTGCSSTTPARRRPCAGGRWRAPSQSRRRYPRTTARRSALIGGRTAGRGRGSGYDRSDNESAADTKADVKGQTRQILERIDHYLREAGTSKSQLLTANLWIKDMALFADMNSVWNELVAPQNPPARACVRADLARPEVLVEIMVTAAK